MLLNIILCFVVLSILAGGIYMVFFRKRSDYTAPPEIDPYNYNYLKLAVKSDITATIRMRPEDLNLNEFETKKQKKQIEELKKNIKVCISGDAGAKAYVMDYISSDLQQKRGIADNTINKCIPFDDETRLSTEQKFFILLQWYENTYGGDALAVMIKSNGFDQLRNERLYVDDADIISLYHEKQGQLQLTFTDKIKILTQMLYQDIYGHGCVDKIRTMNIDGFSIGVSGIPSDMFTSTGEELAKYLQSHKEGLRFSYDSVWIMLKGRQIYLSCLGAHSEKELKRICKNLYRYNASKNLSANTGYLTNDMKDGSRIAAARPPVSDSWVAICRKHSSGMSVSLEEQIQGENADKVRDLIKSLVRGEQTLAVTGGQACGKTTMIRNLMSEIRPTYTIRVQESIFELWLRKVLPDRNIITLKQTDLISGQALIDLTRKIDSDVIVLGEIAEPAVAAGLVQTTQTGGSFTMFSNHGLTVKKLLSWFRNALLRFSGFSNEKIAMEQAVEAIPFDLHMKGNKWSGERFCERLTEIVPCNDGSDYPYRENKIFEYDRRKKAFTILNRISPDREAIILDNLTDEEAAIYRKVFEGITYNEENLRRSA